ncbi:MAG: SEC-C metal-binding domain-containing protein [Eubacteriales bacterium]
MGIMKKWQKIAYSETTDKGQMQQFWNEYFLIEKGIYEEILKDPSEVVSGTVAELATRFDVEELSMLGFLDGINDSLVEANDLEAIEDETIVQLGYDKERLYKNMVAAGADWLYDLEAWKAIYDDETRKRFYKEQKASTTIVKDEKVYPNDPCTCGSGKKYKKCCGKH